MICRTNDISHSKEVGEAVTLIIVPPRKDGMKPICNERRALLVAKSSELQSTNERT